MTPHDKPEFEHLLREAAAMYQLTLSDFAIAAYYRVLKPFDLETIRRAVLHLLGDEARKDGMPRAAEIKAVARGYERGGPIERYIVCQGQGCTSLVPWPPATDGEAGTRCPTHQDEVTHGPPATPAEISAVVAEALAAHPDSEFLQDVVADRARRLAAGESPVQAALHALTAVLGQVTAMRDAPDDDERDPGRLAAREQQRREQLQRAQAAGLFQEATPHV